MGLDFSIGYFIPERCCHYFIADCYQDVIKTRVQTWDLSAARHTSPVAATYPPLLTGQGGSCSTHHKPLIRPSTYQIVREAYTTEGISIFFKGLGVCSVRAFLVNAVQWAVSFSSRHIFHFTVTDHEPTNTGLRMDDEEIASSLTQCYLVCRRSRAATQ